MGKHPATIYRWLEAYERSERVSVFLRKGRSDRGKNRLSNKVNAIIENAIKKIYLKAEQRVAALPDRLKLEKRKNRKAAAERYEPIKGHFPGADYPLAVAQIDHTPMDVIVVDEEHRQPICSVSMKSRTDW